MAERRFDVAEIGFRQGGETGVAKAARKRFFDFTSTVDAGFFSLKRDTDGPTKHGIERNFLLIQTDAVLDGFGRFRCKRVQVTGCGHDFRLLSGDNVYQGVSIKVHMP
jgi:hypothetical protein